MGTKEKIKKYSVLASKSEGEDKEYYEMMVRHFIKIGVWELLAETGKNYDGNLILFDA